jgi:hypothetical protein|tara:strand:+ start:1462 stop:1899 length:438 start_codon:yes stop_codon:yes gene_type:complete
MHIDIERILLELESLPEYDQQLSLQITSDGKSGEGKLVNLDNKEKDFNVFAYDLPYTNSVISELKMYRTRVMNMAPKTCYTYHQDPTERMHIPLVTNDKCFFVIDDRVLRIPADGNSYLIDTRKMHTFINASFENRIHIVGCVDT